MAIPRQIPRRIALAVAFVALVAACGGAGAPSDAGAKPSIVVTTNILGDIVENLVGDHADVVTLMPVGTNPHGFQVSARQTAAMRAADLLVVNGGGFEDGLTTAIDGALADGVAAFVAFDAVPDPLRVGNGVDPHFFTDPARMAAVAESLLVTLDETVAGLGALIDVAATNYIAELRAVDVEVEQMLAAIPAARRVLVTNHDVLAYFADRYGFEVVGAIIPNPGAEAAAGDLAALADLIQAQGVPAIFADTSSPAQLANTLASEAGDVAVVELFSESLGSSGSGADTYLDMVRTNAKRIGDALG
jgi:zinc/manganese transport system substrate-binding protein